MFRCANDASVSLLYRCLYIIEYGELLGCRDRSHLNNCGDKLCLKGFAKCPGSYCVAANLLCNGNKDCPEGEDELDCDMSPCPVKGMYRCRTNTYLNKCLPEIERCDGKKQCPAGDDEWFCNDKCPTSCSCTHLNVNCNDQHLTSVPSMTSEVRSLNIAGNQPMLSSDTFSDFKNLGRLDMSRCGLSLLDDTIFRSQHNLRYLDLSDNLITEITAETFSNLGNLLILKLNNNPINIIRAGSFIGLDRLPSLTLRNMTLRTINRDTFKGLKSLNALDISDSNVFNIESSVFGDLPMLKFLNISQNNINNFEPEVFSDLSLTMLLSDDYVFCCLAQLTGGKDECLPEKDEFSSCEDLLSEIIQRTFMWLMGWVALLGNLFVFIWWTTKGEERVSAYFVKYLSIADFLMGVYMISIASVDAHYRGRYIKYATSWKESTWCATLGAIATISSEASVLTLFAITADRLIIIVMPFSSLRFTLQRARYTLVVIWLVATAIGLVPFIPVSYFDDKFYSRSGACVSLHITEEVTPGWEYSVAVFHGLNFFTFMFIFLAYAYMHYTIRHGMLDKKKEMAVARRMAIIVFTDFFCWVPINIMGILAMCGVSIPREMYVWTVVFILPVNSALNPVLYTISSINFQVKKKPDSHGASSSWRQTNISADVLISDPDPAFHLTISDILNDPVLSDLTLLPRLAKKMTKILNNLHKADLVVMDLNASNICVRHWPRDTMGLSFKGCPMPLVDRTDKAEDVIKLGKVIARLLRAHASLTKTPVNTPALDGKDEPRAPAYEDSAM